MSQWIHFIYEYMLIKIISKAKNPARIKETAEQLERSHALVEIPVVIST